MSVMPTAAGKEAKTEVGMELIARTGIRQRETQVAWTKKARRNLGGEFLILSKRESLPSADMRAKR